MSFPLAKENRRRKAEGAGAVSRRKAFAFRRRTGWKNGALLSDGRRGCKEEIEGRLVWVNSSMVICNNRPEPGVVVPAVLLALGRLREKDGEFKTSMGLNSKLPASLAYISRRCLRWQNCTSEQNHFDRMVVKLKFTIKFKCEESDYVKL